MTNIGGTDSWAYIMDRILTEGTIKTTDPISMSEDLLYGLKIDPIPVILDGELIVREKQRIYSTSTGLLPRIKDIVILSNTPRRTVNRWIHSKKRVEWFMLRSPTQKQINEAYMNVNELYIKHHFKADHCNFCNAIDEAMFKEGCWLVSTTHDCNREQEQEQEQHDIEMVYSYGGVDYTVNFTDWLLGSSPHLTEDKYYAV